ERMGCAPERLFDIDPNVLESYLAPLVGYEERDRDRVRYLIEVHTLLCEKYSLEMGDIVATLKRSRFFKEEDVAQLTVSLESGDTEGALKQVYRFMEVLRQVILNPEYSEGAETIYLKRHVAAGIPSMYGRYNEPKFDALGLTFRMENVASRLIEQMIQDINLNYVTTRNLRRICSVLSLFQQGLELDGIYHERFNSNLKMLESSFTSASCSLDQYTNIFEFLER
ncbi:MAG: hypothetical protein GY852_02355, partial [bacterium]|nr:hypothetical protein [bacterium]